jgi:superfamily II DNA/RNA helicase
MMKNVRLHRKLNMLMITATPLINTVYETKSLLQLATGQLFKEITNRNTLANLSTMHCNLLENSIRFKANYDVSKIISDIECKIRLKLSPYRTVLNDVGHLGMDQIALSEAKLPKIIEYIKYVLPKDEKVILFTKYVTGMVDIIAEQLSKNGISYTYYTGSLKQGLRNKEFEGNQQVLIASSAISEGIDRLQHICNNLWIVGYPWTDSEREQVIGRVYRKGQRKNVSILNFLANINGYDYDRRIKLDRLDRKKTFSTTILEGVFPNKNIKRAKSDFNRAVDSMIKGESVEDSDILNTSLIKIRGKRRKK